MKSNKKLIIAISIVFALAVASAVIAYLFLMTDVFKSNKELFAKYFSQNTEVFQKITDLQTIEIYENLKNENKYESNTNIEIIHSEGGEISNPLNNLIGKIDIQKLEDEQYLYVDGQILYEDEKYLEMELIRQEELYGVRFTDAVQQFITVKKDENLEDIANDIGINIEQLEILMNIMDENEQTTVVGQMSSLRDKYLNIITTAISNGTFKKQKDAMITYNNVTTETNAYSVELSGEQVRRMIIEILNNVKADTEILPISIDLDSAISWANAQVEMPVAKVTVYEQEKQTIRTVVEIGVYKITIENTEQVGEIKTKISYLNSNEATQADVQITKNNIDEQESLEMIADIAEGEKSYTIAFSGQMKKSDGQIELNAEISNKQDITTESLTLENKVTIGNNFEKAQTLDSENNKVLNEVQENKRKVLIDLLKQLVQEETNVRIDLLKRKLMLINEEAVEPDKTTQVEINKFNSKFEFYTGDEVSAENVKTLLDIVKNHLASCENIVEEPEEGSLDETEEENVENEKLNLKLNISKDTLNEEATNQILEKISNNKKYKVSISYKEDNGLIDYITITEV